MKKNLIIIYWFLFNRENYNFIKSVKYLDEIIDKQVRWHGKVKNLRELRKSVTIMVDTLFKYWY